MRKILCLLLVISMLLGSVASLASCDFIPGVNEDISGDHTDSEGDNTDSEGDNTDSEGDNTDSEGDNTDSEGDNTDSEGDNSDNKDDNTDNEGDNSDKCTSHLDNNNNDYCDLCNEYVVVVLDFYAFNDLHGKFCDTDTQPGVDEIGTYFENMSQSDDNMILLSSGDMWQGSAESTLSFGRILVEWMNALGFVSMTLGNHEFDWGEDVIRDNLLIAEFPFLAINIYDSTTDKLVDYCTPSIMIERDGIQIGIIGAIGDCYSSIASDMVENVYFKVGDQLTNLVKAESERLRSLGADIIVYSLHDGTAGYDVSLSNGYVDVVFEGHTHSNYTKADSYGVYHVQSGGENNGISHVEIAVNSANGNKKVNKAGVIQNTQYADLPDHDETEEIEDKYHEIIDYAYADLGYVSRPYSDNQIEDFVAQLYLEAGIKKWGDAYDIVLGGGFLRTRTPYDLTAGTKKYADLLSLFPFNNKLVLCSVTGSNLKSKFINSTSSDYHVALSDYGSSISISNNATYYIIVDSYTAVYAPNRLTIVDYYDDTTYARDLLAEALIEGRLNNEGDNAGDNDNNNHEDYTLTSIPDVLAIGNKLSVGQSTSEYYYVKGTVVSIENTTYGNMYIEDENGNKLYVYGVNDLNGNRYSYMANKPRVGDTVVLYSVIYRYTVSIVEFKSAVLIEIE